MPYSFPTVVISAAPPLSVKTNICQIILSFRLQYPLLLSFFCARARIENKFRQNPFLPPTQL